MDIVDVALNPSSSLKNFAGLSIDATLQGLAGKEEKTVAIDGIEDFEVYRNANITTYTVGESAPISDYVVNGQRVIQLTGTFLSWKEQNLIKAIMQESLIERMDVMDSFMDTKQSLTLSLTSQDFNTQFKNLKISSYSIKPHITESKLIFELTLVQVKTFKTPEGL